MSLAYGDGFFFFERDEWRRGPLPLAADARFRPPRAGDILKTDEASLRRAHEQCLARLRQFERDGYRYPVLPISMTSMWRYDNDPPFPPLSDFVVAWNKLGLQPKLRLTTATQAMRDLEKAAGAVAPEYQGEWTDWWANGTACAPREVAASRFAKRFLAAAQSPVWGPLDAASRSRIEELTRDLCLFDEHTWGSGMSVGQPYSLDAQGQWNEKARLAWRPMALAEWLLGQRARTRLVREPEGLWLANPAPAAFSGWANLIASCLRDDYRSVVDPATGARLPLYFQPGPLWGRPQTPADLSREDVSATFPDQSPNRFARFWVEKLDAAGVKRFELSKESAGEAPRARTVPVVKTDAQGWPTAATWAGMRQPLFTEGLGDVVSVKVNAFAPRWALQDIWNAGDADKRQKLQAEKLEFITTQSAGQATLEETPHTLCYTQPLAHPRFKWATRRLELWKGQPRARLTVRFNRLSSFDPELLCVSFPMQINAKCRRKSWSSSPRNGGPATLEETPHTLCYTQPLAHPRFKWATRRLELWKGQPRARLTVRFNRLSSFDPELLCVVNPLPCDGTLPRLSSGGLGFTPFTDQLTGTCRDYFAIDGWAHYATPAGHWLWVTRDAPLVTLDGPHPKGRLTAPPARTGRMLAIVYDNFWYTNFQGDSPGVMEFQFDLAWREQLAGDAAAEALANTLVSEPVLVLNPSLPENPLFLQRLYRP